MDLTELLKIAVASGASDLHLKVGSYPMMRINGALVIASEQKRLDRNDTEAMASVLFSPEHLEKFRKTQEVDLAHSVTGLGRFRCNVFQQRGTIGMVLRVIPTRVKPIDELGLPPVLKRIAQEERGLVLVTGTTGSGKSTTLAAMIDHINSTRSCHIMTVEDPIEYLHRDYQSIVNQREVAVDTQSFSFALRSALRQDPDVILVGELRDQETTTLAIEASETGHLVFGTLHTRGAAQAVDRIIDSFPADGQAQVRQTLADNLRAVIGQDLVRTTDGRGRRVACEIMVMTSAVAQLIRDGKTFQIPSAIATGRRSGMQLMDQTLLNLVRLGEVDPDEAFLRALDKKEFIPFVTRMELLDFVGAPVPAAAPQGAAS
jgi:twitching motility protein PilT